MSRLCMDRAVFRRLYKEGLNDRQIAERCGVSAQTVGTHRRKLRLPAHNGMFQWDEKKLAHLRMRADAGWRASEIATEMGVSPGAVRNVAARHRISIRAVHDGAPSPMDVMVAEMVHAGWMQKKIALELGVSAQSVSKRVGKMRKLGLLRSRARSMDSAPEDTPEDAQGLGASGEVRLPRVRMAGPRAQRPAVRGVPGGPVVEHGIDRREGVIARLSGRHDPELVQALAAVSRKGGYRKLARVAETHRVPIRTVEAIWHQVRA